VFRSLLDNVRERLGAAGHDPLGGSFIDKTTKGQIKRAGKHGLNLAPFIAMGCPGLTAADGQIERGGQNLPGNWEHKHFNLPDRLRQAITRPRRRCITTPWCRGRARCHLCRDGGG